VLNLGDNPLIRLVFDLIKPVVVYLLIALVLFTVVQFIRWYRGRWSVYVPMGQMATLSPRLASAYPAPRVERLDRLASRQLSVRSLSGRFRGVAGTPRSRHRLALVEQGLRSPAWWELGKLLDD
jgi:hypothetical protein